MPRGCGPIPLDDEDGQIEGRQIDGKVKETALAYAGIRKYVPSAISLMAKVSSWRPCAINVGRRAFINLWPDGHTHNLRIVWDHSVWTYPTVVFRELSCGLTDISYVCFVPMHVFSTSFDLRVNLWGSHGY